MVKPGCPDLRPAPAINAPDPNLRDATGLSGLVTLRQQGVRVSPASLLGPLDRQAAVVTQRDIAAVASEYRGEHRPMPAEKAAQIHGEQDSARPHQEEVGSRSLRAGVAGGIQCKMGATGHADRGGGRENKIKAVALKHR